MKTSELTGAALDWAVMWSENSLSENAELVVGPTKPEAFICCQSFGDFLYGTNWAQGGPIIERESISILRESSLPDDDAFFWFATSDRDVNNSCTGEFGPTPLIAAMRCYVASKLGDDIELPKELSPRSNT